MWKPPAWLFAILIVLVIIMLVLFIISSIKLANCEAKYGPIINK